MMRTYHELSCSTGAGGTLATANEGGPTSNGGWEDPHVTYIIYPKLPQLGRDHRLRSCNKCLRLFVEYDLMCFLEFPAKIQPEIRFISIPFQYQCTNQTLPKHSCTAAMSWTGAGPPLRKNSACFWPCKVGGSQQGCAWQLFYVHGMQHNIADHSSNAWYYLVPERCMTNAFYAV